jgi:hypothetical protein
MFASGSHRVKMECLDVEGKWFKLKGSPLCITDGKKAKC